ncbi:hypothetical protein DIURU_004864 [Diutina rugosa]|uniref:Ribosomal protein/NADH dehydrogenase domain-containing protein n=1 Tax=Diutina rugosa TaxID=5481 RepID=A0A642UFG0_DIURU|nr:uncharacterized protein DIURU_004864 [Diutina rugosa]KAA8898011.1 hypothetical protein DIURU_004864 [Diutina rugosa]
MSAFRNLPSSPVLRQVARLNQIAGTTETAFRMDPSKIKAIELVLVQKNVHQPSSGLRKFWKQNLPTLQFHNNDVRFTMTRVKTASKDELAKVPASVVIHKVGDDKVVVNCLDRSPKDILRKVVHATGATPVPDAEIPRIAQPTH